MNIKTSAVILLCLMLSAATALASTPPMPKVPGEMEWKQDGKAMADTGNVKSKNGFGAQLWLTGDEDFFDKWNRPETPSFNMVSSVSRNKPVFAIILFVNPGLTGLSDADVTADIVIKSPDGSIYSEFKDLEVWKRSYPFGPEAIQLAAGNIGIVIEDSDQLGTYTITAVVTGHVKHVVLELHASFTTTE